MAYTPTTWVTGDDVTATKLNKIENGIANAKGNPYAYVTANGFSTTGSLLGYFTIGKLRGANQYEMVPYTTSSWNPYDANLAVNSYSTYYIFPSFVSPSALPEGIVLLWVQYNSNMNDYTYSGDISQTLYEYFSDSGADGCRVVTGNFEFTAVAT